MTINYRQVCVLILLSLISMKFLALPSLMYIQSNNMTWFVALIIMLIDSVYVFLIVGLLKKSGSKNLNEFLLCTLGPVLTKIVLLFLAMRFIISFMNLANGLEFFIEENFYHSFNWPIFIIPMVIATSFMCYKGIRNIGRVSEIFGWAVVFSCLYISFRAIRNIDTLNFLPLFNVTFKNLAHSSFTHIGWFGSSTFLLALFGKVDFEQENKLKLFIYVGVGISLVQFIYFIFIGLFGSTCLVHNFCISDICQFSTGHASTDELLWLVVSIWVVGQTLQIALYTYCSMVCIKHLINAKSNITPILANSVLLLGFAYLGTKTINLENNFMSWYVSGITIITQYILPLIMWLGYFVNSRTIKKVVKNEKQIQNSV